MTWADTHPDLYRHADPRVFATNPDDPESGRVFVWAEARWFERVDGASELGAVEFSPIGDSEPELREWLREQGLEIDELDDEFATIVRDEFLNQQPLYPEGSDAELSDREPGA